MRVSSWCAKTLVAIAVSACPGPTAEPTKAEQCGTLQAAISEHDEPVQALVDEGTRVLRKTAAAHEEAGAAIGKLVLSNAELIDFRRRFGDNARDLASARRDLAAAIESADRAGQQKAEDRLKTSQAAANNLAAEIARHCEPKP